ncbi:MAG: thioredoxin domain-containing protein [Planctomycetota bacterium]
MENITNNPKLVLVLFTSTWCRTCKQVLPFINEVAQKYPDKIDFREIDVAQQPELATKYEVLSLPTLMVLKNGLVIERLNGFFSKDNLIKKLNL